MNGHYNLNILKYICCTYKPIFDLVIPSIMLFLIHVMIQSFKNHNENWSSGWRGWGLVEYSWDQIQFDLNMIYGCYVVMVTIML